MLCELDNSHNSYHGNAFIDYNLFYRSCYLYEWISLIGGNLHVGIKTSEDLTFPIFHSRYHITSK